MKLISGAVVEGWKWGQGPGPDKEWTDTVTHYSVEFSPDGRLWTVVKDEYGLPRVSYYCHTRVYKGRREMEAGVENVYSEAPKRRRRRQWEHQRTVGLLSKTKSLQVRHAVWLFHRLHCSITT